tara:strand:+ start:2664 stop:3296 length:633 start_codon:yes stop_codon:yes gene_type:complete
MYGALKKESSIERHKRWKLHIDSKKSVRYCFGKPELTIRTIDSLFWIKWLWDRESTETEESAPLSLIDDSIKDDMQQAMKYLSDLIDWFYVKNNIRSEYQLKTGVSEYDYSDEGPPLSTSINFTYPWIYDSNIYSRNRTRKPSLTRRRVNGLWWLLVAFDLLFEDWKIAEGCCWLGWAKQQDLERFDVGLQFINQLAEWHEFKHPTAQRK